MKAAIDLHIHTALSPCASNDMTPNNIINMAMLKELDAIAITDHNGIDNIESVIKAADNKIIVIPGIEVQSREEIHLLSYFRHMTNIKTFYSRLYKYFNFIDNNTLIFGEQLIMDNEDTVVSQKKESLITSVDLDLDSIIHLTRECDGICVPAHIDRPSYSIVSNLGFIPNHLNLNAIEISKNNFNSYTKKKGINYYYSSDAHELGQILEREMIIDIQEITIDGVTDWLEGKLQ